MGGRQTKRFCYCGAPRERERGCRTGSEEGVRCLELPRRQTSWCDCEQMLQQQSMPGGTPTVNQSPRGQAAQRARGFRCAAAAEPVVSLVVVEPHTGTCVAASWPVPTFSPQDTGTWPDVPPSWKQLFPLSLGSSFSLQTWVLPPVLKEASTPALLGHTDAGGEPGKPTDVPTGRGSGIHEPPWAPSRRRSGQDSAESSQPFYEKENC